MTEKSNKYFLEYERCVKQHHHSPRIFVCVDRCCKYRSLLCHYCISDSYHNYEQQSLQCDNTHVLRIIHVNHNILPIEEYIHQFRYLYFINQKSSQIQHVTEQRQIDVNHSLFSNNFDLDYHSNDSVKLEQNHENNRKIQSSPQIGGIQNNKQKKDWIIILEEQQMNELDNLRTQVREINEFVNDLIKTTEEMLKDNFSRLRKLESDLLMQYSHFDSSTYNSGKLQSSTNISAVTVSLVHDFVNCSLNFHVDDSGNFGETKQLEFCEPNDSSRNSNLFRILSQKDIKQRARYHLNQLKEETIYFHYLKQQILRRLTQNPNNISCGIIDSPLFPDLKEQKNILISKQIDCIIKQISTPSSRSDIFNQTAPLYQDIPNIKNNNLDSNSLVFQSRSYSIIPDIHQKSVWRIVHLNKTICASCSSDGTIKIWEIKSNRVLKVINSFCDAVNDLTYLPKSKLLVSVSGDNKIRIFSLLNYKCLRVISGHLTTIYTCYYDQLRDVKYLNIIQNHKYLSFNKQKILFIQ